MVKSHAHSFALGAVLALTFTRNGWLLVVAGMVVGWFGRDVYNGARYLARYIRRRRAIV